MAAGVASPDHAALAFTLLAFPLWLDAINEGDTGTNQRERVAATAPAPSLPGSLQAIQSPFVREPAPFVIEQVK